MTEIIAILATLSSTISPKTLRQLTLIVEATLSMSGRVTMLGISRWTEKGCSYSTVQRFFKDKHKWGELSWLLIKEHLCGKLSKTYILAGDEVVVTKSGKQTFGLGTFFSSIQNKVVSSICFVNISLIDVESRKSYPLYTEQLVRDDVKKSAPKGKKGKKTKTSNKKPGRPKGSKNKSRTEVELSPFLLQLKGCILTALQLISLQIKITYFVYDGALGNNAALQMVKQTGLHIISKLRHDSELYFPYEGEYSGRGKPRKYGEKVTLERLTDEHLCHEFTEGDFRIRIYQVQVWHKKFPNKLNVVIIVRTNLRNGKVSKVLLFSDDLKLAYDNLIDYYKLRFQIEFNFRDAKQYWGLEDFMNIKEDQVNNAASFSLFMVTFSQLLLPKIEGIKSGSMQDLKTVCRAQKLTLRVINSLGLNPDDFLNKDDLFQAAEIGRIHARK